MRLKLPATDNPNELPAFSNPTHKIRRYLEWLPGGKLAKRAPNISPDLDYLMALFSQVAYVPTRFEASNSRRTSVVPSSFFQKQVRAGRSADIAALLRIVLGEEPEVQVRRVTTGNSVTTLTRIRNVVVIATRGTSLFHQLMHPMKDLIIDVNAWHIPFGRPEYRYHFGFLEEASASIPYVRSAYEEISGGASLPIYFTGHSLGGALSAVSDRLWETEWPREQRTAIVFGCPRFGNSETVSLRALRAIKREGDPVPQVPPRFLGYADPIEPVSVTGPDPISRWRPLKNHKMELYRRAVAERADILADDATLYRLMEMALAKEPKIRGF